jgi:hypothetical protein
MREKIRSAHVIYPKVFITACNRVQIQHTHLFTAIKQQKANTAQSEVTLGKDESTGRYTKINFLSSTFENLNEEGISYDLSITSVKDDEGYEEAMKDYEYKKMQYEQEVDEINAKTASLQQKDKSPRIKIKAA